MKTIDQIGTTPSVGSRRNLNTQTAVASLPPQRRKAEDKSAVRPFHVNYAESELTELRRRINATRWPERETDATQGVPLATIRHVLPTGLVATSHHALRSQLPQTTRKTKKS